MLDKFFYKNMLQNMFSNTYAVTFWDGETITYGEGNPASHLTFHQPISKQVIMDDATLAFEEAFSQTKDKLFIRMWRLYLNACAAAFNCGNIDRHQIIFAKGVTNDIPWNRDYLYQ